MQNLRSGERGSSRAPQRLYSILVTGEVALACALLVSSVLLVRTVSHMSRTPTGVDADETTFTSVQLTNTSYDTWTKVADVHASIIERIRQQPGVRAVGGSNHLPLDIGSREPFAIEGEPPPARPEAGRLAQYHSVSEGFFEAMGAVLVAGRLFSPFDGTSGAPVVIVNETFAKQFLVIGPATGRIIVSYTTRVGPIGANLLAPPVAAGAPGPPAMRFEVVGVVRDVRDAPLGQVVEPAIYFSTRQFPFRKQFIAVRATDRATAAAAIKNSIAAVGPDLPSSNVTTWGEHFSLVTAEPRLLMTILLFFGGLAALLAALGVYGLFSWSAAEPPTRQCDRLFCLAVSIISLMNASEMARALGRKGGRARGKRLSAAERKRIASLGGKARRQSLQAAGRIADNFRYAAALADLRGRVTSIRRLSTFAGPLPGIYRAGS